MDPQQNIFSVQDMLLVNKAVSGDVPRNHDVNSFLKRILEEWKFTDPEVIVASILCLRANHKNIEEINKSFGDSVTDLLPVYTDKNTKKLKTTNERKRLVSLVSCIIDSEINYSIMSTSSMNFLELQLTQERRQQWDIVEEKLNQMKGTHEKLESDLREIIQKAKAIISDYDIKRKLENSRSKRVKKE